MLLKAYRSLTALGAPFIGVFVLGLNAPALGLYCMVILRGAEETKMSVSIT